MNVEKIVSNKPKILLAMPVAKGDIALETFNSVLGLDFSGSIRAFSGSLVDDAREQLALDAIEQGFDYVLWCDSDMVFEADALNQLLKANKDIVTGLCFKRVPPYTPAIYNKKGIYLDYPKDWMFPVEACGFAFVLTKVSALKEVYDEYHTMFARAYPYGEDISFCKRWKSLEQRKGILNKYEIWCDSRVKIGHVGSTIVTEKSYELVKERLLEQERCQKEKTTSK